MSEEGAKQPSSEDSQRRYFRFVRTFRLLCFTSAVVIGFGMHWSGLAWIPIGVLLFLAIFGFVAGKFCDLFFRVAAIYYRYLTARDFSRMSPANRELFLSQLDPDYREEFLNRIKKR
jgi:hypothetical protein